MAKDNWLRTSWNTGMYQIMNYLHFYCREYPSSYLKKKKKKISLIKWLLRNSLFFHEDFIHHLVEERVGYRDLGKNLGGAIIAFQFI